ncbi:MAG: GNAT family N-acetyltransferase [Actinobacteria bacterium]|nr:GNAT family N-acetyltransferase [Actinomycetota bacterium]
MTGFSVRPLEERDAARVGELTLAAYDASGGRIQGEYRDWLADPLARVPSATAVLVAVDDATGEVLGTVTFVRPGDAEFEHPVREGDAGFRMLAVAPETQGRGVGDALIAACVTRAREEGAHRIVLSSMSWMTRAHGMYRRRGFVRRPDLDVAFPGGTGVVFTLDLTPEAASRFGPPGPPREPLWYEEAWADGNPVDCGG